MSKEIADNSHKELEEIINDGVEELKSIMTQGSQKLNIPVLEPYRSHAEIRKDFSFSKGNFHLSINKPIVTGIATLSVTDLPSVSLKDKSISLTVRFNKLKLESDDFAITGDYKPLLFKHNLNKSGGLELDAEGIKIAIKMKLELQDKKPVLIDNGSQCTIEDINLDIEDSVILDLIFPFFKSSYEDLISSRLQQTLCTFLTHKLQAVCEKQAATIGKLKALYSIKKSQGFDRDGDGTPEPPRLLEGFGEVGELPLPLFWELPSVDVDNTLHVSIDKLLKAAKTGDVILFSGSYPSSQRIRRMTQSCFSHVIVVINEPDIAEGRTCIWQATSSTHKGVLRNMLPKSGIQLNYLEDMIHDYREEDAGAVVCWRSLTRTVRAEAEERERWEKLKAFIHEMDSKPYTNDMDGLYIMGLMEIDNPNKEDYFCAGIVAESLMRFGILKTEFYQYQYAPRDFSERQPTLPFVSLDTQFEDEVVVD